MEKSEKIRENQGKTGKTMGKIEKLLGTIQLFKNLIRIISLVPQSEILKNRPAIYMEQRM